MAVPAVLRSTRSRPRSGCLRRCRRRRASGRRARRRSRGADRPGRRGGGTRCRSRRSRAAAVPSPAAVASRRPSGEKASEPRGETSRLDHPYEVALRGHPRSRTRRSAASAPGEQTAVGREGNANHCRIHAGQAALEPAGGEVPDQDRGILDGSRCRGQSVPVGREGQADRGPLMAALGLIPLATRIRCPRGGISGPVRTGDGQGPTVRRGLHVERPPERGHPGGGPGSLRPGREARRRATSPPTAR